MQSTFINKYLHFGDLNILDKLTDDKNIENIARYQNIYIDKLQDKTKANNTIITIMEEYIKEYYNKINVKDADINYFIKNIVENYENKFMTIIEKLNIKHSIKLFDCNKENKDEETTFKTMQKIYYQKFYDLLMLSIYGKDDKKLNELIQEDWKKINFDYICELSNVLTKLKFNGVDIEIYKKIYQEKFNNEENTKKLLIHIVNKFVLLKNDMINSFVNDINEEHEDAKYNFRFIIENLQSNGYLLFEEYKKNIQKRYEQNIDIETIKKDLYLINYFIKIISMLEKDKVNQFVNETLINIKIFLQDLEESYYNNETYKKIQIHNETQKYKSDDIKNYNRNITNFMSTKYINYNKENILTKTNKKQYIKDNILNYDCVNKNMQYYLDTFSAFYKIKFPDREFEYDLIDSKIVVKMNFSSGQYNIEMSLIQYIILDLIMKTPNISVNELCTTTNISLLKLNNAIESLLKIQIIKKVENTKIIMDNDLKIQIIAKIEENTKLILNDDFNYENKSISIFNMTQILKQDAQKQFAFDRVIIILCNIINYVKKNAYFSPDTILEEIKYKIPFKINEEQLKIAIQKALEYKYIKIKEIYNKENIDIIYEFNE
jgi:hypothetical protein